MARPIKTGLDSFPFDVDLFQNEKVVAIAGEFGLKGEMIIVKLLCAIYRKGYYIKWNDMFKYALLKELPGISGALLDSVLARLLKWDFFNHDLFESDAILTSRGIQRRYRSICIKMHRKLSISKFSLIQDEIPKLQAVAEDKHPVTPKQDSKQNPRPQVQPSVHIPQKIGLDRSIAALKADTIWGEPVCMRYSLRGLDQLHRRIDDFRQYCITYGETEHDNMKHVKRHFCQWLNKQNNNQTNYQNHGPSNTGAARRAEPAGQCLLDGIDLVQSYLANPDGDPMP